MSDKKYLLYFDILGFEKLAEEIATKKDIKPEIVRQHFIDVIKERLAATEAKGRILGKHYDASDSWLLVVGSPDKVFQTILDILEHNTGYNDYDRMPLEIAVGIAEFDQRPISVREKLILQDVTITFFKNNPAHRYREWFKDHNGKSEKSTFVVFTESARNELEPWLRGAYKTVEHGGVRLIVADPKKVQEKGRVFSFLEKIGHSGSALYDSIDWLYVPPLEFPDIVRTLQQQKIVFIVGTQEFGKTYTAVRLLWEYYLNGYEPRWIKGDEPFERYAVRQKLQEIQGELKPKHIIYFEDPFGKVNYETRENLEREIGLIIDIVAQAKDAYVIITSREEVFKEFERHNLAGLDLHDFEWKLGIQKPSYSVESKKTMAVQWAERENCKWLQKDESRDFVLRSLNDEKLLPTPLSVKDFAFATVNITR
jgi:hypothetical protein